MNISDAVNAALSGKSLPETELITRDELDQLIAHNNRKIGDTNYGISREECDRLSKLLDKIVDKGDEKGDKILEGYRLINEHYDSNCPRPMFNLLLTTVNLLLDTYLLPDEEEEEGDYHE